VAEIYSHSRLSSFEDCPRKFQYRYVLKLPSETEGIEAFVGKRVHEVLERLYRFTGDGKVPSLARVLERFHLWWEEHFDAARIRIVREGLDAEYYRRLGERCLTQYYRRNYPFDADETLAVEERVLFSLDPAGEYRLQGFVDRVVRARDGALEIHDYKTSARVPRQEWLDRDRQLALYQMGLAERFGHGKPVRLVWHYLAPNQVRTSQRTPEQLETLRADTIALIDRVRAEQEFKPKTGPLCSWCEFNDICEASPVRRARPRVEAPAASVEGPGTAGEGLGTAGEGLGTAGKGPGTAGKGPGTAGEGLGTAGKGPGTAGKGPATPGGEPATPHEAASDEAAATPTPRPGGGQLSLL
jgi:putative RecB family exonuclease